jgi:hypothetical protein
LFTNIRDYPLKCVNFPVKHGSAVFTYTKRQNAVASFVIILGLYQIIRRVPLLSYLFGMKAREERAFKASPS